MKICWKKPQPFNLKTLIRYLPHSAIDKEKWDTAIRHAFNGNLYAYHWYLDIVHPGWGALVEDDYVRVMPLTGNRKWGVHYLFQPFFVQQLGVFSTEILNSRILNDFFSAIPAKFRWVQVNLNVHNKPHPEGYRLIPQTNYLLDLIPRYSSLASRYASNTKRNLKKSLRSELTLQQGLQPPVLTDLFRQNKGREVKHWHEMHYQRLHRLMYRAMYLGLGLIYGVYDSRNELCAGAFFLRDDKHLIFLFSATSAEGRRNGAMTFLLDHVIRANAETARVLDFEGSNDANLARFYSGFGAKEVTYYRLEMNRFGFPLNRLLSRLKQKNR
jgi:hypothetical protein